MNILYISKLDGRPWIGPTYSVPKQVAGQCKFDNVMWYNMTDYGVEEGKENMDQWRKLPYYVDLSSYPQGDIELLPEPFCKPDLIVVEQGYPYARNRKLRKYLENGGIPYIIVPRGEFTKDAQSKKRWKKIIGNLVLGYHRFTKRAIAIQCLTEKESVGTSLSWNKTKVIMPNGTNIPEPIVREYGEEIRCVFIGRLEPYQKGIDLLMDACSAIKPQLEESGCRIDMYGAYDPTVLAELKKYVELHGLSDIVRYHDPIYGEEKFEILKNSDVFLIPSRFEGHPTGLLEALAYGLPSVATTGSNMRTEIEEYEAGWTADCEVESLKQAMLKMLEDKDAYKVKSENALKLAHLYDWDAIAGKSHEIYAELLGIEL